MLETVLLEKNGMIVKVRNRVVRKTWENFLRRTCQNSVFLTEEFALANSGIKRLIPLFLTVEDINKDVRAAMLTFADAETQKIAMKSPCTMMAYEIPAFLEESEGTSALNLLLNGIDTLASQIGAVRFEIVPRYHNLSASDSKEIRKLFSKHGYACTCISTVITDLDKPLDQLWKKLKERRKNIKRAKIQGVTIEEGKDHSAIKEYYELHYITRHRQGLTPESYSFFEKIWENLINTEKAKILFANYRDRYIGGLIILTDANRHELYAWRAESLSKFWRLRPNDFIFWSAIEWGKKNGYKTFDMVHYLSDKPICKFYNLYRFKKNFGTTVYLDMYSKTFSQARLSVFNLFNSIHNFMIKCSLKKISSMYLNQYEKASIIEDGKTFWLRPLLPTDTKDLWEMISSLSDESIEFFHPFKFSYRNIEKIACNPDYNKILPVVALIKENKRRQIAAFAYLGFQHPLMSATIHKHSATLGICVHDSYQNKRVGSNVIRYLIDIARREGIKKIYLSVHPENKRANHLFEKQGFKIIKLSKDQHSIGRRNKNLIKMVLTL